MFGVYFLGNDTVIDWAYAFAASFRKYNPDVPLTLIPYNDNLSRISALAEKFDFDILASDTFGELDRINLDVVGVPNNHTFRKFAAFWGKYDTFLFLDSDIVIMTDLKPIIDRMESSRLDMVYSDSDHNEVYRPGEFRERMLSEYNSHSIMTGVWWSKKDLFTLPEIESRAVEAAGLRDEFVNSWEQPFFNYCCDMRRIAARQLHHLMPELLPYNWANSTACKWDGNRWVQAEGEFAGKEVYLLHFAGTGRPNATMPNYSFYLKYRVIAQGFLKAQVWNLRARAMQFRWWAGRVIRGKG